jgi:probable HAF family extracellular repeat protein
MLAGPLALLVALALTSAASAASYTVTDLGTLGGETSEANAINNAGEVAGTADTSFTHSGQVLHHAFRYSDGKLTDLSPGGPGSGESCSGCTQAYAINGFGDVAGGEGTESGDVHPSVWKANGTGQAAPAPDVDSEATGINDADEVIGTQGDGSSPWLDTSEGLTTVLKLKDRSFRQGGTALGINNKGEVVGASTVSAWMAFLYSGGVMHELGTLGGESSVATALNESGTIVGSSEFAGGRAEAVHAFSYHEGTMTDLGTLPEVIESEALAVNESDEIVGTSGGHAFLYRDGSMTDLNSLIPSTSGWTLTTAKGINASGEIVGTGLHNGIKRAFLLQPAAPTASVSLVSTTIAINRRGQAAIMLTCTGTAPSCVGALTLTAQTTVGRGRNKHTITVTIGTVSGSIASGQTATVELRMNATGRALLSASHGTLAASLKIVKSSPAPTQEQTEAVSLVR